MKDDSQLIWEAYTPPVVLEGTGKYKDSVREIDEIVEALKQDRGNVNAIRKKLYKTEWAAGRNEFEGGHVAKFDSKHDETAYYQATERGNKIGYAIKSLQDARRALDLL